MACLLLVLSSWPLNPGQARPPATPTAALPAREALTYQIEWRFIHAGNARLSWERLAGDRPQWQASLQLESVGLVSRLFKVDDRYTIALADQLCAVHSMLTVIEGSRYRETKVTYDRERRKASYLERDLRRNAVVGMQEVDIPACAYDVVGALYRLRTLRGDPGQHVQLPVSDGKKSIQARAEAQEREVVKTPAGAFRTLRYEVFLFNNVLYRRKGRLFVWLTDDERRLPVQIRVRLPLYVGTITLQLTKEEKS